MRSSGRAKVATLAISGGIVLGGMGIAGALPGVSNGTPPVETPDPNDHAGDHPDVLGVDDVTPADSSSRDDGLANALSNVTNEHAQAVLEAVSSNTPGPGFGAAVSDAASEGASQAPSDVPPAQADAGLSHKP